MRYISVVEIQLRISKAANAAVKELSSEKACLPVFYSFSIVMSEATK